MCEHMWNKNRNKTEIKLKQIYFISADHRRHCFISVLFQRLAHVKHNAETTIVGVVLKQLWNKSKTFNSCSSVLFQFRFTCPGVWNTFVVPAYRYIAITTLAIIAVFLGYLRQFLIDLHQTYRHSSVP